MNLLLDTQILLWVASTPEKMPLECLATIENPDNNIYYSNLSIWEIGIKNSLQRSDFYVNLYSFHQYLQKNQYNELPIKLSHVLMLEKLPKIHKDPFDRMLIAQALVEDCILITSDRIIKKYNLPVKYIKKNV